MRPVAIAACLMVLGVAALARADGNEHADHTEPAEHERAVGEFEEGRKLLLAGDCDDGIGRLKESLRHEPSIGARVSLADCYEPANPLAAWRQLKEAARLALFNHDDRLVVVEGRASALEPRLAMIRVVVPEAGFAAPGFELTLDGELVDPYLLRDGRLATTPGSHQLEAWTPGRRWSQTLVAAPGSVTTTNVQLVEACSAGRSPVATPRPLVMAGGPSSRRVIADVLTGAGVAGIAAGAAFGVLALQKKSDLSSACGGDTTRCTAPPGSLDVQRESAQNAGTVSAVGLAFGGAALVGAVVLFVAGAGHGSAPTTANVQVTPQLGAHAQGMGVVGRW